MAETAETAKTSNFDEFKGKDCVFVADWLKTKGLHKLCSLFDLFRSTKWSASLILACNSAKLVPLCKVTFWKTHIPVRAQKWPPRLIFAGACHSIVIRDLKIPRRYEPGRLPEVNLLNRACAEEL